ncbi:MAG: UDP-2,3-diacylglucosamine diphosphatase [Leadbetterella sp.]
MLELSIPKGKKIYFASDFHLGAPNYEESRIREQKVYDWIEQISVNAHAVFFVGDVFDFWFEYPQHISKQYDLFYEALRLLKEKKIEIYFFRGNHDMWMGSYFPDTYGVKIISDEFVFKIKDSTFFVSHGDGLGPGDIGYKLLKKVFRNPICIWLFRTVMPAKWGTYLGNAWAQRSWKSHKKKNDVYVFNGWESEYLYQFCVENEKKQHFDYYIFGHRHFKSDVPVGANSRYINLGDWIHYFSYAEYDGEELALRDF